jgi:peptidoglycan lytic transglycosylase
VILTAADAAQRDDGAPLPAILPPLPPSGQTIRLLLSVGLFDDAMSELRFASRVWGNSSQIQATIAWIQRQLGRSETGAVQFGFFRGSMTTMKAAYPQYLAAGGELLPRDLLVVIFPVAYWDTIKKYSAESHVDPYIVAALTAQESTFVHDITSYAGAVGLMQFMAPTARQYARRLKLPYSATLLTTADANLHMGATYFADLVQEFGDVYLALAAYNAGPGNVRRWMNERPNLPREEFIDDIPYPQTQNYVKKILATSEDYRRLYGPGAPPGDEPDLDVKLALVTTVKRATPAVVKPAPKPPAAKPAAAKPAPAKPAPALRVPAATRK